MDEDVYIDEDSVKDEYMFSHNWNVNLEDYKSMFNDIIRLRGEEYYKNGTVEYVTKEEDIYTAEVDGSEKYDVKLYIEDDNIEYIQCSCAYYTNYYLPCKHVYAVLKRILNNEYEEIYIEPCICPSCKSSENVIPIVYGKKTENLVEKINSKAIVYGGEIRENRIFSSHVYFKKWHCKTCNIDILNNGELNIPMSFEYIGKNVKVTIDRKLGSKHPKWDFIYPINYGYVPNTVSGDNEELDAYILGEFKPLDEFEGICIAVIHRFDDNDNKLIVVGKDKTYSDAQIKALTEFQERFFKSEIIR